MAISNNDRITYDLIWFLEHVLPSKNIKEITLNKRKKLSQSLLKKLSNETSKIIPIEEIYDITPKEFRKIYLSKAKPVILKGSAKNWGCIGKWTPEFLTENYGNDQITLIDASPDDTKNASFEPEVTTLKAVINSMEYEDPDKKKYSRFNRILYDHPELKKDINEDFLLSLRNKFSSGSTYQVFIGGKETKTNLHAASEHNLFTQVYGKKKWVIYPPSYNCVLEPPVSRTPYYHSDFDPDYPDYNRFPAMQYLDRYEFILEEGDILFNPPSYWHYVKNMTDTIGFGFRWFHPYESMRIDFIQLALMILAQNPNIFITTKNRADFTKIFSHTKNNSF